MHAIFGAARPAQIDMLGPGIKNRSKGIDNNKRPDLRIFKKVDTGWFYLT